MVMANFLPGFYSARGLTSLKNEGFIYDIRRATAPNAMEPNTALVTGSNSSWLIGSSIFIIAASGVSKTSNLWTQICGCFNCRYARPRMPPVELILVFSLFCALLCFKIGSRKHTPFPPGPPADPIIGHLRIMPSEGHDTFFYELGKKYGMFYLSFRIIIWRE